VGLEGTGVRGAEVANLALTGKENPDAVAGLVLDDCRDCRVDNVLSAGMAKYGIWLRNNTCLCRISGCSLVGNRDANIFLESLSDGGPCGDFIPNLISDCVIYGGGRGVACSDTIVLNIVGCVVYQVDGPGFHITERSNSVLLSGCRTFQISSDAVVIEDSDEINLTGNTFCWHTGSGIVARRARWGTINGNAVIDSGSHNPGGSLFGTRFDELDEPIVLRDGIDLTDTHGYTVSGNAIFNWGVAPKMSVGIRERSSSGTNVITSNNVNYFEAAAVISDGTGSTATNNTGLDAQPHRTLDEPAGTVVQAFDRSRIDALIAETL
jgi:hypothetical protein